MILYCKSRESQAPFAESSFRDKITKRFLYLSVVCMAVILPVRIRLK